MLKIYLEFDEISECFSDEKRNLAVHNFIKALRKKLEKFYNESFAAEPAMFTIMIDWMGFDECEPYRCYCEFFGNIKCFNYEKAYARTGGMSSIEMLAPFVDRDLKVILIGVSKHEIRRRREDDCLMKLMDKALIEVEAEWGNENAEV